MPPPSGGERRRVEIARALATGRFILLDEPFAGVDPIAVLEIQKIIRFLKERGIGVLITDHNVRETLGICDHAYIMNGGSCRWTAGEIVYKSVRKVYLGENFRPLTESFSTGPPASSSNSPNIALTPQLQQSILLQLSTIETEPGDRALPAGKSLNAREMTARFRRPGQIDGTRPRRTPRPANGRKAKASPRAKPPEPGR